MDKWIGRFKEVEEIAIREIEGSIQDRISLHPENPKEVDITFDLISYLSLEGEYKDIFYTKSQIEFLVPKKDKDGIYRQDARMDFILYFDIDKENMNGEIKYLGFEAKKLNYVSSNRLRKNADEYRKGVAKFASEKYSPECPMGCMLGYVINGKFDGLQDSIQRELLKHKKDTKITNGPISLCSIGNTERFETKHSRKGQSKEFLIRHTLLNCKKCNVKPEK